MYKKVLCGIGIVVMAIAVFSCTKKEPLTDASKVIIKVFTLESEEKFDSIIDCFWIGDEGMSADERRTELLGIWKEITQNASIKKIEILKQKESDGKANNRIRIKYKNGSVQEENIILRKEDKGWQIIID